MNSPAKVAQIKDMKACKEGVEAEMGRILYAFRNGYPVSPVALSNAQYALTELLTIAQHPAP